MTQPTPGKCRGQKPADLVSSSNYSNQDIIWKAIRQLQKFTAATLVCHIGANHSVNNDTVKSYVRRLLKGGYLQIINIENKRGVCRVYHYALINDTGVEAPRLTKDGKRTTQGLGRENLWRAIRILSEFDHRDLKLAASTNTTPIKTSEIKNYITHLHAAGYLIETRACKRGYARTPARYRLLPSKNTGPKPPMIQRLKRVFDPNLGKVMWREKDKGSAK